MLNNSGESGHPCLVPDLRGKAFSFSLFSMMLAVGLSYMAFIMLRYLPSMPILLSFYHEWMLNFVECFFSIYGDDLVVFDLLFTHVVDDADGFSNVVPSLHPWDESHLVMVYDPFDILLNSVC